MNNRESRSYQEAVRATAIAYTLDAWQPRELRAHWWQLWMPNCYNEFEMDVMMYDKGSL